ncbi:hypothetical protein GW17_00056804 [Ensete ventricosum]|nr:hypothetical protein GW17_00056804 [Ensete ventricosum]
MEIGCTFGHPILFSSLSHLLSRSTLPYCERAMKKICDLLPRVLREGSRGNPTAKDFWPQGVFATNSWLQRNSLGAKVSGPPKVPLYSGTLGRRGLLAARVS